MGTDLTHPFEADTEFLRRHIDAFVEATIADLASEFLLLPRGQNFIEYEDFRTAYEILKRHTQNFNSLSYSDVFAAAVENSRVVGVVRAMLGMTPGEWADLARAEVPTDVNQQSARVIDRDCKADAGFLHAAVHRRQSSVSLARTQALIAVAVKYLTEGAPPASESVIHRLAKFDTQYGLESIRYAASQAIPYAAVLYERYLGRPFASHRDAVSELVGEVMENAIEDQLRAHGISNRKTKRAERIPGFGQAPDFCVPDEKNPAVVLEAKITSDDGTARDKVARIKVLAAQRDRHIAQGRPPYEVIACIDGRGFQRRREDMRQMLLELNGKVFTTATLNRLVGCSRLAEFVTRRAN